MSVNMLLLCCSCLFFFVSSFEYNTPAHTHVHKPSLPLFFLHQLYISAEQRSLVPPFQQIHAGQTHHLIS